ncbi:predicted protein [Naegleria gruberi]|uniref:Predicted protein n=1 Tax=Naegleria gruberi TaxID=5762 RepID=D2V321_NAEGR|nr:uncharacterized protein NAEGRDRAFT_63198 [Naegleria gruberi]EFC48554.1 predicted protein [Naegleria gruberi]|eukprot:XP_002681298.1 predicted protein [Naegleria gruberi strain NEG-M]
MPRLIGWMKQSPSRNNQQEAADDISQVVSKSISESLISTSETVVESTTIKKSNSTCIIVKTSSDLFLDEISIHIAEYLDLKNLNSFARVDSNLLKLLFNRQVNETKPINYVLDENSDFERIQ